MACYKIQDKLKDFNPTDGSFKVIVGLCGCNPRVFECAAMVMKGSEVVLAGGLEKADVNSFMNDVKGKVKSLPLDPKNVISISIVVPCPPPKLLLSAAQMTALDTALTVRGKNLADVFR